MKLLGYVSFLSIMAALSLLAAACEPVSVPPWPYTTEDAAAATDGGASADGGLDDGASDDGGSSDGSGQGAGPAPLRCDGGLCNTDNYSLCNIADGPAGSGAGGAFSVLAVVAGLAIARKRNRRKARRSS